MTPRFTIEELAEWIEMRFDPASGPGGQNVNKVSTRATLLFDFANCDRLTEHQRMRIARRLESRLARDGRLRIVSQEERSQSGNRAAAEARLLDLLAETLHVQKTRRPTRPTAGSQRRRVDAKRRRGAIKQMRGRRPSTDD